MTEDLQKKETLIRNFKVNDEIKRISESQKAKKALSIDSLATDWEAASSEAIKDDRDRRKAVYLVNNSINKFMCLAPRSLCVIGAASGTGKSTFTANIAYPLFKQGKKVLIIVNEETTQDVGIRIACLELGISIHKYKDKNLDALSKEDRDQVQSFLPQLRGSVDVIGLDYKSNSNFTTTVEGLEKILDEAKGKYDCIVIDYYQNICRSLSNPNLNQYQVQELFANLLDREKHIVGCPLIVFAQMKTNKDQDSKERLEGRKILFNKATDFFEMLIDKENNRSAFKCLKDRWLGRNGDHIMIGYDAGRFVEYDSDFVQSVSELKISKLTNKIADGDENEISP